MYLAERRSRWEEPGRPSKKSDESRADVAGTIGQLASWRQIAGRADSRPDGNGTGVDRDCVRGTAHPRHSVSGP